MRQKAAAGAWRAEMSGSTAAHVRFWQRQKATALLPQLLVCQGQQPSALCDCRAATCSRGGWRRRRCGRSVLHAKLVCQPSAKHMQSRGVMAIFAGMGCADRLRISASPEFSGLVFLPLPAGSLFTVFACARKCNKWRGRDAPRSQGRPLWKGMQQGACSLAALPKGCFAKAASAVLPILAGQAARFLFCVACFAPCSYCLCTARHTI